MKPAVAAAVMLGAGLACWGLSRALLVAPCWSLLLLVACVAWPIWYGQREYALFQRRLALGAATLEESRVRRWLWRGRLLSFFCLLPALGWAAILLLLIQLLGPWHLALLAADAVVLALAVRRAQGVLAGEVREDHLGLLSRRWILAAGNVALLMAGFFLIDYFAGAPDTRGLQWNDVATQAFARFEGGGTCPLVATLLGFLGAVDALAWHVAQQLVPALPGSGYRMLAWVALLAQAGFVGVAYTRMQVGVLALLARAQPVSTGRDGLVPAGLPVLLLASLWAAWTLRDFDPLAVRPMAVQVAASLDPCRAQLPAVAGLRNELSGRLEAGRVQQRERIAREVNSSLDEVFARAEAGVETYLDWYFSLKGEYQRLGVLLGSWSVERVGERIGAELQKAVFETPQVPAALRAVDERLVREVLTRAEQQAAALGTELQVQGAQPCWDQFLAEPSLPAMQRDLRAAAVAGGSALIGAATTRVLAARFSQAVAARLAARPAYRGAASVAGRLAGKRAGSTVVSAGTGTAACAPGGPLSVLCGLAAAGVTWLAVDKAMIEIDEWRFREAMRAEILDALAAQKLEVAAEMLERHGAVIDLLSRQTKRSLDGLFIPARDG